MLSRLPRPGVGGSIPPDGAVPGSVAHQRLESHNPAQAVVEVGGHPPASTHHPQIDHDRCEELCPLGTAHDGGSDQEQQEGEDRLTDRYSRNVVAIVSRRSR